MKETVKSITDSLYDVGYGSDAVKFRVRGDFKAPDGTVVEVDEIIPVYGIDRKDETVVVTLWE